MNSKAKKVIGIIILALIACCFFIVITFAFSIHFGWLFAFLITFAIYVGAGLITLLVEKAVNLIVD